MVSLHEGFKARTSASEGDVRTTLKAKREAYSAEDAEREGALDAAVAAVGQVCVCLGEEGEEREGALDAAVAAVGQVHVFGNRLKKSH